MTFAPSAAPAPDGAGPPHVEPTRADVAVARTSDHQRSDHVAPRARPRRRSPGALMFSVAKRLWIPLVTAAVIAAGGWAVSQLHGIFGSDNSVPYGDTRTDAAQPVMPKHLRYEVFGPAGTTADISFFDADGDPRFLEGVVLPWSLDFPITSATGVGSVAAQGDSDSIGCRLWVDDTVKAEKVEHAVSAFTSCLLKAA
jgi:hypothetical protein